ncbi:MAG: PilZ domain-containing protein [Armatimonadetes bacterium]|nr:MAG: PilZ domain-containing protein [Armatimonadota bacterium]
MPIMEGGGRFLMSNIQSVQVEHPCGLDVVRGVLVSVDKQRYILSVHLDADAEFIRLGAPVYVSLLFMNDAHRLNASVKSKSDLLVQLQVEQKRAGQDRRRARRYPLKMVAHVQQNGTAPVEVHLQDISIYGAGFRSLHPWEVGQHGTLILTLMGQQLPIRAAFEVRHCISTDAGYWRIGVRFIQMSRVDLMWLKRLFPE